MNTGVNKPPASHCCASIDLTNVRRLAVLIVVGDMAARAPGPGREDCRGEEPHWETVWLSLAQ